VDRHITNPLAIYVKHDACQKFKTAIPESSSFCANVTAIHIEVVYNSYFHDFILVQFPYDSHLVVHMVKNFSTGPDPDPDPA